MSPASCRTERLASLDAARGTALLFSLISHFGSAYFRTPASQKWASLLVDIGMVATPTFVVVSGLLLGFLFQTSRDWSETRTRLIDRGLFLLVVGHWLIAVAFFPSQHLTAMSFSTDAIGAALIAGPLLIPHITPRNRLLFAVSAYALSWLVTLIWFPGALAANFVEEVTVGNLTHTFFRGGSFPVLPWLSVYLASSVYGERFARLHKEGRLGRAAFELGTAGALMVATAIAIKIVEIAAWRSPQTALVAERLHALFRIGQKSPPGPGYILFYGGIALCVLTAAVSWELRRWPRALLDLGAVWGEASLAIFVIHHYALWFCLYYLTPSSLTAAPVFFAALVVLMTWFGLAWRRWRGNRFITVGLDAFAETSRKRWRTLTGASVG